MDDSMLKIWLRSLKAGDKVAVYDIHGRGRCIYTTTVERRTKSRIFLATGCAFTNDGYIYGASAPCYRDRCLRPIS